MAMAVTTKQHQHAISPAHAYVSKPPPPGPSDFRFPHHKATFPPPPSSPPDDEERQALDGIVAALRLAAAAATFVGVSLVASCRHGDWMEFTRYPEYKYLLGASVAGCLYSAAQAARSFRRIRRRGTTGGGRSLLDFAGDQVVAYLLITAAAAALPITVRMRSAVVNIFTDAMVAAIGLGFLAFAALALSAMLSGFRLAAAARPY